MINNQTEFKDIYVATIKILTRQDYSRYKLKSKLIHKGYEEDLVEEVLERVIKDGFLREDYYIESRVKSLMYRYYSKEYIFDFLTQEHLKISQGDISRIFDEYGINENDQASSLLQKKLVSINREKLSDLCFLNKIKARLINYLASKGYDLDLCEQLVDSALKKLKTH